MAGIVFGGFVPGPALRGGGGARSAVEELAREVGCLSPEVLAVVGLGPKASTLALSSPGGPGRGIELLARLRGEASLEGVSLSGDEPLQGLSPSERALLRCVEGQDAQEWTGIATAIPADLPLEAHYRLGQAFQRAAAATGRRVCILAWADAPPAGHGGRFPGPGLLHPGPSGGSGKAPQPLAVLCGALAQLPVLPRVSRGLPDEGRGHALAFFSIAGEAGGPHPFVRLARETLERALLAGSLPDLRAEPACMRGRAGVFVCLKELGELRGCVGTIRPARETLAEEIMQNALSAALRDYRFLPVAPAELPYLTYTVDVLTEPQPIEGLAGHDPRVHGLVAESGSRRGLLLPDIPGIETPEQQLEVCRMKGGIEPGGPVKLYRFTVQRYKEVETD